MFTFAAIALTLLIAVAGILDLRRLQRADRKSDARKALIRSYLH